MATKRTKYFSFILGLACITTTQAATISSPNYDIMQPFPAFKIIDNIYYVGTAFQADYLIVTPKGDILINSGFEENVPQIKANLETLGFKWSDIKILLISHAHKDHAGGSALIEKETGAKYIVMDGDVSTVESGGKDDFLFGNEPNQLYQPTHVERILHDGDTVTLGNTTLTAHRTPGHTKGNTTWTMNVTDHGKMYHVVIVGATTLNPGVVLVNNPKYPNIAIDYQHTFDVLNSLPCDVFLGAHGMYFGLEQKYSLINQSKINPFIDSEGYKKFITNTQQKFQQELAQQEQAKIVHES